MKDHPKTGVERILGVGEDDEKKKQPTPTPFVPSEYSMYPTHPHTSTGGAPPPPDTPDWLSDFNAWAVQVAQKNPLILPGKNRSVLIYDPSEIPPEYQFVTWETELNPCDTCLANQAAGIVEYGRKFPGGVTSPPQHMNCKCILLPVLDNADILKVPGLDSTLYIVEPKEPKNDTK